MNCVVFATDRLASEKICQLKILEREFIARGHTITLYGSGINVCSFTSMKKIFFIHPLTLPWGILWLITFPFLFFVNIIRLSYIKKQHTPHAIVCATYSDAIAFALCARVLGIPSFIIFPQPISRLWRWIYRAWTPHVRIILPFASLQHELSLSHTRLSVIPPCIAIRQQPLPLEPIHTQIPQRFILGTASSLIPHSGVEYIIKAIPLIQEMLPHIQLVIVGNGPEKQRILWLIAQLGLREHIKLVGSEENREKWIKHFTLFAFCPAHSFVPMQPVLEAMAARKVVIASDIPPLRDIITQSKNGILVPPHNSEMIAQAVINLFNHPDWRETMGGLAAKHMQEYFSIEAVVSKYEQLFNEQKNN